MSAEDTGKVTSHTLASVSLPKKRREHDTLLTEARGTGSICLHLLKGPLKGCSQRGSPVQLSHDTGAFGGWGKKGRVKARKGLSVPGKWLSPTPEGANARPRPSIPSLPKHTGQPQHLSFLPASPSVPLPPLRPRPRTQPGSSSSDRVSAADPPATRRRQGLLTPAAEGCRTGPPRLLPGLPARRAGARLAARWVVWATERKKRQEGSKGPLYRPEGESSLNAGPRG